jgi:DNA polymerase-3 subunit alpha (Gram-positive type)
MKKKLLQALPLFVPTEPLRSLAEAAEIINIALQREEKIMELTVQFDRLVPPETLTALSAGIASTYRLTEARIIDRLPADLLNKTAIAYLVEETTARFPSAAGFFSGCLIDLSHDAKTVTITLADGGKELVEALGCVSFMQNQLRQRFSVAVQVKIEEAAAANPKDKLDQYVAVVEKELAEQTPPAPVVQTPTEPTPAPAQAPPPKPERNFRRPRAPKPTDVPEENVILGKLFGEPSVPMDEVTLESGPVAVCGEVFDLEVRLVRDGAMTVITADITDKKGSVRVKRVMDTQKANIILEKLKKGAYIRVRGDMEYDRFSDDTILKPLDMYLAERPPARMDNAPKKRVELHLHTTMSAMDGVSNASTLIQQAIAWGQPAVAITDHGVTQAFPEAMYAAGGKIKVIYGMEGYFVNNADDLGAVRGNQDEMLSGEFVCFDIETTGTDPRTDGITEIAAVIVKDGEVLDTFHTYSNPGRLIPPFITELTGITNAMVQDAPPNAEAVAAFRAFCGNRIVVAHNAAFDTSFVQTVSAEAGCPWDELTSIDTLALARVLMPNMTRHRLNIVAEALGLPQFRHHNALEDTKVLAQIFIRFVNMLTERGAEKVSDLNEVLANITREANGQGSGLSTLPVRHIILLVKNTTGLKNLYKLVSMGHLKYMNRRKQPIIPKSELMKHREGLLVGSACEAGELYRAVMEGRDMKELRQIAKFYDFLEIQPLGNNEFLQRSSPAYTKEDIIGFNKQIVRLGQELSIPVVATGDVHFCEPEDELFRRILMAGKGFEDADQQAPLHMRTTEEMLAEFTYLGRKKAYEVVVENTNFIADQIENIKPVPDGMFPPELPGSAEELEYLTYSKAYELYGDPLPEIVSERIAKELGSIIKHDFDVMYMIAQKLIQRSNENGYMVGSRGSVGSSVVAFFSGITEINALPPHYRCHSCHYSDFNVDDTDCGLDLPDKSCPVCGEKLDKDGFNIPFETFLGFDGDKAPDIDLNFSGEYQALAHKHTIEMFGEENVFRAGTIATVASKTAFGYVKKYNEERGIVVSKAEENRRIIGCTGVKRTTGQHPGGLIVVPRHKEIYDFCPVQRPADDLETDIITTHVDYHSIDENLLKLDLLGKDDPTILRYLEDQTGVPADKVSLHDPNVLELFISNKSIGIESDDITGPNGALGIPEYGTSFVRQMLVDTQPKTIADLVRISGLSHGTDVWLNNAKDLILEQGLSLRDCICCRDDIMDYLIKKGLEPKLSFTIMESVRKGRKLKPEWEEVMREKGVPEWYIGSCNKIAYMFPKAHAAAYVVMALRIAWFKVYEPLAYYSSFFSIKAKAFDPDAMLAGDAAVIARIAEIRAKGREATAIEEELVRTLEITHEFLKRGFKFLPVDLYASDADRFIICREENALRLPFAALPGFGGMAGKELAAEREKGPFLSVEDLSRRCSKVNSVCIAALEAAGALSGLAASNQMTLFEL